MSALRAGFQKVSERPAVVIGVIVGAALVLAGTFFYLSQREERLIMARNAYFLASKMVEDELKAIVPAAPKKKGAPAQDEGAPSAELEQAALKPLDVDKVFAGSVVELKTVVVAFQGTRPAFDALLALGNLYFDHGKPKESVHWYGLAVEGAPGEMERALALQALAAGLENAGQTDEAIQKLEEAVTYEDYGTRGDALLALARNFEIKKNVEKARSTYDRIISEFPDSAQARAAESYRALLK